MKNILLLTFSLFSYISFAQVYLLDQGNIIYEFDPESCGVIAQFEAGVEDTLTDLAMRMDGQLYGITQNGKLYQINAQTGDVLQIHSFLNLQSFEALYCSNMGLIYVGGSEGFLYTFEISSKTEKFLGDIGIESIEDLLIYANELYASTSSKKLLHLDLEDLTKSSAVINVVGDLPFRGLYTSENPSDPCAPKIMMGISEEGKIYQIESGSNATKEICTSGLSLSGATSSEDLFQYSPLEIFGLKTTSSQCKNDNGSIFIDASGGTGQVQFSIGEIPFQSNSSITGLAPGLYTVQIKDANDCIIKRDSIKIDITEDPVIEAINRNNPICAGGQGSLSIQARGITALEYSINNQDFQNSPDFLGIAKGRYEITVQDTNGCTTSQMIEIVPEGEFEIKQILQVAATCNSANGEIEIELSDEFSDLVSYLDNTEQNSLHFTELSAGFHTISIRQGEFCQIDTSILLNSDRCPLFIPNAFSPDQDGKNDDFRIYTSDENEILIKSYDIFDRWGGKIYTAENFSIHEVGHWWDGRINSTNLTQGMFVFVIELVHQDGEHEILKGQVTVM